MFSSVIPANIPLGNSQALKAEHRTVGVITKIDLAGARDKVEQKILGTVSDNVMLPNGCITYSIYSIIILN